MKTMPIVKAAKVLGICCGVAFFVVLLTLVFSFLGTIICAALAGMMMGATKPSRWLSHSTALLFPAVIYIVLHVNRAELSGRQIGFVALLCYGAFWLTYFAAAGTMVLERKPGGPTSVQVTHAVATQPGLADLQGKWDCHQAGSDGKHATVEIEGSHLVMSAVQPDGRVSLTAKATLELPASRPAPASAPTDSTSEVSGAGEAASGANI